MILRILLRLLMLTLATGFGCAAPAAKSAAPAAVLDPIAAPFLNRTCPSSSAMLELWRERSARVNPGNYPIGPGDLLRITVVGIEQLDKQEVRVSGDGTITMPFAGTIPVSRMSDDDVARDLESRLSAYIRAPQVSVFDEEDKSRTVRVMGLVNKPGLIILASPHESLMDALAEAGGLRDDASQRILFIPGKAMAPADRVPAATPGGLESPAGGALIPASYASAETAPIVMNLHDDEQRSCFELPARPGDTLIVPVAGNVTVDGWVTNRGAVNLTPGMTVTGAIAAAGGALFSSRAKILRENASGVRVALQLDLAAIEAGREPDPPVEAGDVVVVERSVMGAAPYAVYSVFARFTPGFAIPLP